MSRRIYYFREDGYKQFNSRKFLLLSNLVKVYLSNRIIHRFSLNLTGNTKAKKYTATSFLIFFDSFDITEAVDHEGIFTATIDFFWLLFVMIILQYYEVKSLKNHYYHAKFTHCILHHREGEQRQTSSSPPPLPFQKTQRCQETNRPGDEIKKSCTNLAQLSSH